MTKIKVFEGENIGLQAHVLMTPIDSRHIVFDTHEHKSLFDAATLVKHLRSLADTIEKEIKDK